MINKNKEELPKLRGLKVDEIISKYPSAIRIILRELLSKLEKLEVNDDWLPTPENINALPEPVRKFIHDLETNTDPAHLVQENVLIKDTCKALVIKLEEKQRVTEKWLDDFIIEMPIYANAQPRKDYAIKRFKEAGIKVVKE